MKTNKVVTLYCYILHTTVSTLYVLSMEQISKENIYTSLSYVHIKQSLGLQKDKGRLEQK